MRPASTWSSPRYSEVRPLRGSRPLAMPGPSRTLRCLGHASWPIATPLRNASEVSQDAESDTLAGYTVTPAPAPAIEDGASVYWIVGVHATCAGIVNVIGVNWSAGTSRGR